MVRAGVFSDVDLAITWHPSSSGRYRFGNATFAGRRRIGRDAPITVVEGFRPRRA